MQKEKTIQQKIGNRIQKIRKAKGYTQQEFAEIVDLSTNFLSDIERGKSAPSLNKLAAIINALECTADDIFADVIKCGYKVKSSRISDQIEQLSPKEQEKAIKILEVFSEKTEE